MSTLRVYEYKLKKYDTVRVCCCMPDIEHDEAGKLKFIKS